MQGERGEQQVYRSSSSSRVSKSINQDVLVYGIGHRSSLLVDSGWVSAQTEYPWEECQGMTEKTVSGPLHTGRLHQLGEGPLNHNTTEAPRPNNTNVIIRI
ncbi:hypothetical protein E2C01_087652 [Portunus trituberculatus]|uniref:Uncharacterized protein n=1 Tax=Portunus trituberculatus TaxID=210409 RepID=A0A5B7JGY2_PORTR|nr:hypothetical protein [Portunus trituberculatus]